MSSVDGLPTGPTITSSDLAAGFSKAAGIDVHWTWATVLTFFRNNFTSPTFIKTAIAPEAGDTKAVPDDSNNSWMRMAPAGTLATLTIKFPTLANCADGQEILITSTQIVTTLTVNGNGATVNGAADTSATNWFTKYRFSTDDSAWYIVSSK